MFVALIGKGDQSTNGGQNSTITRSPGDIIRECIPKFHRGRNVLFETVRDATNISKIYGLEKF